MRWLGRRNSLAFMEVEKDAVAAEPRGVEDGGKKRVQWHRTEEEK